jgi:hypothetical protein
VRVVSAVFLRINTCMRVFSVVSNFGDVRVRFTRQDVSFFLVYLLLLKFSSVCSDIGPC